MGAPDAVGPADRSAVADLVARYAAAVDRRDVAAVVACFTDDAHVELDGGADVADGRAAVEALFRAAFARPLLGPAGTSTHLLGGSVVSGAGDALHAETPGVAWLAAPDRGTVVVRGVAYSDDVVRLAGGWRIARRVHRALWQAEMPGRPLPGVPGSARSS